MKDIKYLNSRFSNLGIDMDSIESKFETYYNKLISYNQYVNLTAITEREEVYVKHFLDSCLAIPYIAPNSKVVDVGTGAGFPGVPIKIAREDVGLYLVDSLNKRIKFLDELSRELNINYNTFHSRAEEFATNVKYREQFDVCVSRAVSKLNTLLEYCLPLVKVGGLFIAYKAINADEEIEQAQKALKILGGEIIEIKTIKLPNNFGERNLIIIKKIKNTPKKYPRSKNLPKTNPII